jgi:hypothetical protein
MKEEDVLLVSLYLVSFLIGLRTYQQPGNSNVKNKPRSINQYFFLVDVFVCVSVCALQHAFWFVFVYYPFHFCEHDNHTQC